MRILGLETTCDETGAAVVEDGRKIMSNVVASSVDLQEKYGGVVPEVAAREQVRSILPVIAEAIGNAAQIRIFERKRTNSKPEIRKKLQNSKIQNWAKENIDAIAVAHGPGLIGSLLIGMETAKALAIAWDKPLVPVNHLVGHVYANWIKQDLSTEIIDHRKNNPTMNYDLRTPNFPIVALIVSGGHTDLVLMTGHGKYRLLGSTLDDAAGEAFDKVARVLGLGYPGGPEIERLASQISNIKNQKSKIELPRPMIGSKSFDFSFSGLKTAVVNLVDSSQLTVDGKAKVAAEFQQAVVDVLVAKTVKAAQKFGAKAIVIGGGVAANEALRAEFRVKGLELGISVLFPSKEMSVDNGAMIAAAAFFNFKKVEPLKLAANPSLHF